MEPNFYFEFKRQWVTTIKQWSNVKNKNYNCRSRNTQGPTLLPRRKKTGRYHCIDRVNLLYTYIFVEAQKLITGYLKHTGHHAKNCLFYIKKRFFMSDPLWMNDVTWILLQTMAEVNPNPLVFKGPTASQQRKAAEPIKPRLEPLVR